MRFDDLVRTEKYFTATLLPYLLMHDDFRGLRPFVALVESRASTERASSGKAVTKGKMSYSFADVELVTEFHIARDLAAGGIALLADEDETLDVQRRDAPDLIIVAGPEMLVCEGKFFERHSSSENLNRQLRSQRRQVAHLMGCRSELRAYRHVAIVPSPGTSAIDCDAVLLWSDIATLSRSVLGEKHYVTNRLLRAVTRYEQASNRRVRTTGEASGNIDRREASFMLERAPQFEPVAVSYVPVGETRGGIKTTLRGGNLVVTMRDVDTGDDLACGIGEVLKYATPHEPKAFRDRMDAVSALGRRSNLKGAHYTAERMTKWRGDADGRCAICGGRCRSLERES